MSLRCKFRVDRVSHDIGPGGEIESEQVRLVAVYSDDPNSENAQWSKWTPSGTFEIIINNTRAFGKLTKDHEYFIDLTPVNKEE